MTHGVGHLYPEYRCLGWRMTGARVRHLKVESRIGVESNLAFPRSTSFSHPLWSPQHRSLYYAGLTRSPLAPRLSARDSGPQAGCQCYHHRFNF